MIIDLSRQSLENSYQDQFAKASNAKLLTIEDVQASRDFFEINSLEIGKPIPKKFDTYCIVGGVPFSFEDVQEILGIKKTISEILKDNLVYFVEPDNFGVELAILKWPDQGIEVNLVDQVLNHMSNNPPPIFFIDVEGFQFHRDGCIVLRGFDRGSLFRKYRQNLLSSVNEMPQKQSNWCHVPLGRILSPINEATYSLLLDYAFQSQKTLKFTLHVHSLRVLHEMRWYQLERSLLKEFHSHA